MQATCSQIGNGAFATTGHRTGSTSVWRSLRTGTAGAGAGPQRSAWPARRSTGLAAVGTVKPEATLELGDAGGMDSDRGAKLGNHGIAVGKGRRQVRDPVGQ